LFVLGTAQLVALCIALPLGVLSAVKQYSIWDNILTTLAFLGFSLPTFFTGLVFILVFGIWLQWFPTIYSSNIKASGVDWVIQMARQSVMPIAVLALFEGAQLTRYVRSSMLDVIRMDYVTTARAKGLSNQQVLVRHALRNALIPVVTILALQLPTVFTGAVITEQIFRVPGIGSLLVASLNSKDTPVLMAIIFTYSVLVVVFTLIADVLYSILDPRIKYT
jgi:peptide/nickel transport system permease protein